MKLENNNGFAVFISGFGGAIGLDTDWIKLEVKWKRILAEYDLDYFHCSDFFQFKDLWAEGWRDDRDKCQELYRRLWNAIAAAKVTPMGCLIPLEPYRDTLTKEQRKALVSSYFVTAQTVIGMALASLGDPRTVFDVGRIATIFDDSRGHKGAIRDVFDHLKNLNRILAEKVREPSFDDWTKVIPLQVADMVAYESHREYRRRLYTPDKTKKYGWQRLENLHRNLGYNTAPLGHENSRIVFRPASYIDELAESFTDQWEQIGLKDLLR